MRRLTENKIVLVTRPTRLAELIARFNTASQARFYVEHLGADFSDYQREDENYQTAVKKVRATSETFGRVQMLERAFLPNFLFAPDDTIVVLGQDGLVANTLKYLNGQPVLGVNPDPARWDGQLLPFKADDLEKIIPEAFRHARPIKSVTMAKAMLNNGQVLYGVNDLFIGPRSHISARYTITLANQTEIQSSSGVIVSTGLGSTGWLKSLLTGAAGIMQAAGTKRVLEMRTELKLRNSAKQSNTRASPKVRLTVHSEFPWDADFLRFTVREPFPTRTTAANLVFGRVSAGQSLVLVSQMPEHGVIFSDGIEKDFLEFNSGTQAAIGLAEKKGCLVV
ncbi:MAG TPA: sugar kinase [Verrucomicrobiae bacterium]|jgi:NAD kinase